MTYYIYKIQNKINSKIYIGKTGDPGKRYKEHLYTTNNSTDTNKHLIHKAIKKYGQDNFIFETIEEFENEEDCLKAEKYWIQFFQSNVSQFGNEFGYNLTAGGEGISGFKHSQSSKDKISEANKGRIFSPETRDKMSLSHIGKSSGMLGKHHSDKKKKQQSEMMSGEKNYFYGKQLTGTQNGNAILNKRQIIEIFDLLKNKIYKQKEIAKMYDVSLLTISRIKRRKTYTNITNYLV